MWFICTLLTDRNEHVAAKADSSLSNRRASLSRSLATGLSVDSSIDSANGLAPGPMLEYCNLTFLGTNFNEILIKIHISSFKRKRMKMSSGKCRRLCLGLNVLMISQQWLW